MKLPYNDIDQEDVEEELQSCVAGVKKWSESDNGSTSISIQDKIEFCASDAGYIFYMMSKESESKYYFKIAARAGLRKYELGEINLPEGQTRSAWDFYENLNVLICFGTDEERVFASNLPPLKYDYPGDEPKTRLLVRYIAALKSYLMGEAVSDDELSALINACEEPTRTHEEKTYVIPMIRGLISLCKDKEGQWQEAVSECVERHIEEVKHGDLKHSYDGYFSMPALALVKLGLSKGWKPSVESVYLPVSLIL